MTIDEAIENEKSRAENCKGHYDRFVQMEAKEHEQIAEWLEELKTYRQYIDLTEIPEQYKLGFQDGIIEGNNKAIDNFAILMKETLNHDWATTKISEQIIYNRLFDKCSKIAEQLKVGGKNDD